MPRTRALEALVSGDVGVERVSPAFSRPGPRTPEELCSWADRALDIVDAHSLLKDRLLANTQGGVAIRTLSSGMDTPVGMMEILLGSMKARDWQVGQGIMSFHAVDSDPHCREALVSMARRFPDGGHVFSPFEDRFPPAVQKLIAAHTPDYDTEERRPQRSEGLDPGGVLEVRRIGPRVGPSSV